MPGIARQNPSLITEINFMEILEMLKSGNSKIEEQGYRELLKDPQLNGYIKKKLSAYELRNVESDEVLIDALVILRRKVHEFRGDSKLNTFIIEIINRLILQKLRKRGKNRENPTSDFEGTELGSESGIKEFENSEEAEEKRRKIQILRKAINQMNENCREVLGLALEGMSGEEIADIRGLKERKYANKAVHRCREQLRKIIFQNKNSK